ncbi:restriction endonuclease subunit S domain-containing protein [[Kitasatospora] papulosa]|uniref:restriction endonuclease n=1 Tax=[Kitasatospora] papulosa TaxID=1464011 RepID=UPI00372226E1
MSGAGQQREESPSADRLPFASVFESVLRGWAFNARSAIGPCASTDPGAVRLIWLKNIGRDGAIADRDPGADDWRSEVPEHLRLRAGDILLSSVVSGRPKAAVVREVDLPAVAVRSLLVLRPAEPLTADHARLVLAFLRSNVVGSLAVGSLQQHLRLSELKKLELPNDDRALSAALTDLSVAEQRLGGWAAEAGRLANSVFDDRSTGSEGARRRIIEAGQVTRLRSLAAAQLDDPGFIIRTRYPYPIALRWRNVEAQKTAGGQDDEGKEYSAVLEAAETLLGYSALATVALAHEAGISFKAMGSLKRKIAGGIGGPGFGDWKRVLEQIGEAAGVSDLPPEHPLHDLAALLADDEAQEACQSLNIKRNGDAHGRTHVPAVSAAKLDEAHSSLRLLIDRALFLADLQLLEVTQVVWDRHEQSDIVTLRRLMGDHPVVPTERIRYTGPDRIAPILYLADRDQGLHPLGPFLTCEKCAECAARSVFHADKEQGALLQKSLDHGHSYPYRSDEEDLRAVGLRSAGP